VSKKKLFTCFNCYQPSYKAVNCPEQNSLKQQNQKYKKFNVRSDQEYKAPSAMYWKTYSNKTAIFNTLKIEKKEPRTLEEPLIIMSDGTASFSIWQ
jgi:hypothetical protein